MIREKYDWVRKSEPCRGDLGGKPSLSLGGRGGGWGADTFGIGPSLEKANFLGLGAGGPTGEGERAAPPGEGPSRRGRQRRAGSVSWLVPLNIRVMCIP